MRPLFDFFLAKVSRDRSHLYSYYLKELLKYRSEKLLAFSVVVYELVQFIERKKKSELEKHYNYVRYLEVSLKDKGISLN